MSLQTSIFDNKIFSQKFPDNLQAVIDSAIGDLYGQSFWRTYLKWGTERTNLDFEVLVGRSRQASAASIIDIDSPTPLRSRGNLEKFKGGIPTMGHKYKLDQSDYRTIVDILERNIAPADKKQALIDLLYNDVTYALAGIDVRLDILFLQAATSLTMDLSVLDNPDGAATGVLELPTTTGQIRNVSKVWTDPTSDPIADIDSTINYLAGKGKVIKELWIDRSKWLAIKNYDKVKSAISGYLNVGSGKNFVVTLDTINEFLIANGLPPFKLWNVVKNIETDGVQSTINPFDVNNVAFIQDTNLGTVENAWSIEAKEPVDGVTYAKYDRTLLKKYRSHTPWAEWSEVLLNAIPVIDTDKVTIMQTDVV